MDPGPEALEMYNEAKKWMLTQRLWRPTKLNVFSRQGSQKNINTTEKQRGAYKRGRRGGGVVLLFAYAIAPEIRVLAQFLRTSFVCSRCFSLANRK